MAKKIKSDVRPDAPFDADAIHIGIEPEDRRAVSGASSIDDVTGTPEALAMVGFLVKGHEAVTRTAREAFLLADRVGDEASLDMLTQRLQVHEKTAWMLRSLLR